MSSTTAAVADGAKHDALNQLTKTVMLIPSDTGLGDRQRPEPKTHAVIRPASRPSSVIPSFKSTPSYERFVRFGKLPRKKNLRKRLGARIRIEAVLTTPKEVMKKAESKV